MSIKHGSRSSRLRPLHVLELVVYIHSVPVDVLNTAGKVDLNSHVKARDSVVLEMLTCVSQKKI